MVDGRNSVPVDMVNVCKYTSIYRVLYIPGGSSINSMVKFDEIFLLQHSSLQNTAGF